MPFTYFPPPQVSILYVQGDMAAIVPIYDYTEATHVIPEALGAWRTILMGAVRNRRGGMGAACREACLAPALWGIRVVTCRWQ